MGIGGDVGIPHMETGHESLVPLCGYYFGQMPDSVSCIMMLVYDG